MKGVTNYSCGPQNLGFLSRGLSWLVRTILDYFNLNFERSCARHDLVWSKKHGGPNTKDDIEFALNVYIQADEQYSKYPWFWSLSGFILVRIGAIIYKGKKYFE